jgi:phosphinothricin acetyltransferase
MEYTIERMEGKHAKGILDVFNHYVEHSFAAYPERPLPAEAAGLIMKKAEGYPAYVALDEGGAVAGFGFLHAHQPLPTFRRTAEITYFLRPDACGRGIGSEILELLLRDGREQGINVILASISGKNGGSIAFHRRHGFVECGRFRDVGAKRGETFDVVWMQRTLG